MGWFDFIVVGFLAFGFLVNMRIALMFGKQQNTITDILTRLQAVEVQQEHAQRAVSDTNRRVAKQVPPPIPVSELTDTESRSYVATHGDAARAPADELADMLGAGKPMALFGPKVDKAIGLDALKEWVDNRLLGVDKTTKDAAVNSEDAKQAVAALRDEVKLLRGALEREVGERMQAVAALRATLGGALDRLSKGVQALAKLLPVKQPEVLAPPAPPVPPPAATA